MPLRTPLYEWTRIKAGRPVLKGHEVIRFAHSNQGRRHPAPSRLFWLLQPLALAQAHAGAAAVLVDEFDASLFESSPDFVRCCLAAAKPAFRCFQALYGRE